MTAPRFTEKIELYKELLTQLLPDDPSRTLVIAQATRFALHELIVRGDDTLIDDILPSYTGTELLAHTLAGKSIVRLGEYVLHTGATRYPHVSFNGFRDTMFGADPAGQPMFDLLPPETYQRSVSAGTIDTYA
jgi:hypothetical protein